MNVDANLKRKLREIRDAAVAAVRGPLTAVGDKTDDVLDRNDVRIGLRANAQRVVITVATGTHWKAPINVCERATLIAFAMPGRDGAEPDVYVVPSARIDADWKASHKFWSRGRPSNTKMRELRFDGDPEKPTSGFATKYAEFKIPLAAPTPAPTAAFDFVQRGPTGLELVPVTEATWILLDDDNRGYGGTYRQICEQMYANARFVHDSETTLDIWIAASLARAGVVGAPPTPEIFVGVMLARGQARLYPPGCKLF